jgi:hypothetical protein
VEPTTYSLSVRSRRFRFGRLLLAGIFIFTTSALALAEARTTPNKTADPESPGWHKYVNRRYGFSFWYPDTYKSVKRTDERCSSDSCLIKFERRDDANTIISVSLYSPFQLSPGAGDLMPERQVIGHHVFYSGLGGSMGVGFTDFYELNLKGKALTFYFMPAHPSGVHDETEKLELRMLSTFRTL